MKKNMQKAALLVTVLFLTIAVQPVFAQQAPAKKPVTASPASEKTAVKDKIVGKDDKGHVVYEGAKGMHYYMDGAKKVQIEWTYKNAPKAAPVTR